MALTPFVLQAKLIRGVVAEPYSLDLAGILSSRLIRMAKDENSLAVYDSMQANPNEVDLPLMMCESGGEDSWHWGVTSGVTRALDRRPQEPHTYYRVVNDSWAGRAGDRPLPYYNYKSGAYRDVMMPAHVVLTPDVTWYGVGDIERIQELVSPIRSIGKRRSKGEGMIHSWQISKTEPEDIDRFIHCGYSEGLLRPSPVVCAERLQVDYELAWHAIRPPSWNPNRIRELAVEPEEELYLPEEWEL